MKGPAGILVLAATVVTFSATAEAQQGDVRSSIEAANQQFAALFQKGDATGVAALYTTDGETFPPNSDVVQGRDAIQKMWQSVIDSGLASAKLVTREVQSGGGFAWESGTYELFAKDGGSVDRGKYVVVWKQVQGKWLLHRDIWNSSVPAKK